MSQRELAQVLGVTQSTLSYYEKEETQPPETVMEMLSKKYDVTIEWLNSTGEESPLMPYYEEIVEHLQALLNIQGFELKKSTDACGVAYKVLQIPNDKKLNEFLELYKMLKLTNEISQQTKNLLLETCLK
jgi:transcriptional regulator with XRE-family HTH domain